MAIALLERPALRPRAAQPAEGEEECRGASRPRGSAARMLAGWTVACVACLAAGAGIAGVAAVLLRPLGSAAASSPFLTLEGGNVHVGAVIADVAAENLGTAADAAPGWRRFAIEVELRASSASGLRYDVGRFRLAGPSIGRVAPVAGDLGGGTLLPGQQARGTLVFFVPAAAAGVALTVEGSEDGVPIPLPRTVSALQRR